MSHQAAGPGRFRQVVTNLLSNAIKFTDRGEVHLTASLDEQMDGMVRSRCVTPGWASQRRTRSVDTPRVLVAEDNTVNQLVAMAMLTRLGYQVDVVSNGREAVQAFERSSYVAILMDCRMPVINGYEASAEIRRREGPGRHTQIVAPTASAINGDEERCRAAGMDDYVTKPVTVDRLATVLGALTKGEGQRADVP